MRGAWAGTRRQRHEWILPPPMRSPGDNVRRRAAATPHHSPARWVAPLIASQLRAARHPPALAAGLVLGSAAGGASDCATAHRLVRGTVSRHSRGRRSRGRRSKDRHSRGHRSTGRRSRGHRSRDHRNIGQRSRRRLGNEADDRRRKQRRERQHMQEQGAIASRPPIPIAARTTGERPCAARTRPDPRAHLAALPLPGRSSVGGVEPGPSTTIFALGEAARCESCWIRS